MPIESLIESVRIMSKDCLEVNEQSIVGYFFCRFFVFWGELLLINGDFLRFKELDRYFGQFGNIDGTAPSFNFGILYTACSKEKKIIVNF